jgi:uncharacterized protein GlcG (DUF336 family)
MCRFNVSATSETGDLRVNRWIGCRIRVRAAFLADGNSISYTGCNNESIEEGEYMVSFIRNFCFITLLAAVCGSVPAEEGLEKRPVLSLDAANRMADACEAKAKMEGWNPVNIAIFDAGGDLKLFKRQDNAYLGSIDIAQLKGRSSVLLPFPTRFLGENIAYKNQDHPHGIQLVPGIVVFPGGLPIKTGNGHLLGGIGVSGATSDQDEQCAQASIDGIKNLLQNN